MSRVREQGLCLSTWKSVTRTSTVRKTQPPLQYAFLLLLLLLHILVFFFFFTLQDWTVIHFPRKKPEELATLRETWPTQLDPDTLASLLDHLLHSTPFRGDY